jgi:hypothetical protein
VPAAAAATRYAVNTTLGARVARLNPTWNQPYTDEALDAGFAKAMELTGGQAAQQVRVRGCTGAALWYVVGVCMLCGFRAGLQSVEAHVCVFWAVAGNRRHG